MAAPNAQRVVPVLSYEDAGRAADWIVEAFGFEERERYSDGERRYRAENLEGDRWMFAQLS